MYLAYSWAHPWGCWAAAEEHSSAAQWRARLHIHRRLQPTWSYHHMIRLLYTGVAAFDVTPASSQCKQHKCGSAGGQRLPAWGSMEELKLT